MSSSKTPRPDSSSGLGFDELYTLSDVVSIIYIICPLYHVVERRGTDFDVVEKQSSRPANKLHTWGLLCITVLLCALQSFFH